MTRVIRLFLICLSLISAFSLLADRSQAFPTGIASSADADLVESRPNMILVMTDDQGYGPVGRHGHPWLQTPHMDRMFDASTRFDRFLVSPTCSPTRSAVMTGRHPMRNGVTHTILERERMTLDAVTLPQMLKTAGYTSGIFGKWHLGDEEDYQPHQRGFDEAFIHGAGGIGQAYDCSCADAPKNSYFDPVIRHNGSFVKTAGFCTDVFFTAALGWIQNVKDKDQPFFAYLTTNAPHGPFLAPEASKKRFLAAGFSEQEAGFYGMIENIDDNLGRLLSKLEEWKLLDNTVIIFMSDNGMTGGGSGRMGKALGKLADGTELFPFNADMKGLKGSPEEGGVRVPFFIRWDGRIKAGQQVDRIAAHLDIAPTLCALAGAKMPEGQIEGRSLLPLIADPNAAWDDRILVTHVCRWKTGEDPDKSQWQRFSLRNQQYRFVNNSELFDMQTDPGQTQNIIDQHPDVVEQFRTFYSQWWLDTKPLLVNESAPMSATRPYHELYQQQMRSGGIPSWRPPQL